MTIPPEAIQASARALNPRAYSNPDDTIGLTLYGESSKETQKRLQTEARYIARTVLEAALPHIRKQIATDIRGLLNTLSPHASPHDEGAWNGIADAARIVEEGTTK